MAKTGFFSGWPGRRQIPSLVKIDEKQQFSNHKKLKKSIFFNKKNQDFLIPSMVKTDEKQKFSKHKKQKINIF
jgi:hypothetical protein